MMVGLRPAPLGQTGVRTAESHTTAGLHGPCLASPSRVNRFMGTSSLSPQGRAPSGQGRGNDVGRSLPSLHWHQRKSHCKGCTGPGTRQELGKTVSTGARGLTACVHSACQSHLPSACLALTLSNKSQKLELKWHFSCASSSHPNGQKLIYLQ